MDKAKSSAKDRVASSQADPIEDFPLPIVDLDMQGNIVRVNRAACILYQEEAAGLLGNPLWEFMASSDVQISKKAFRELIKSGEEPPTLRRTFRSKNGVFRTCDVYRCFLHGEDGQRVGLRAAYVDVTETAEAFEASLQGGRWIKSLLASIAEAVVAVDVLGFITYVNPAAEEMIGWTAKELQGKSIEDALPVLDQHSGDQAILALESALDRRAKAETLLLDSCGRQQRIEIHCAPIIDQESGSITGVISVLKRLNEDG
jgi:PAS domain S-box-containing protein